MTNVFTRKFRNPRTTTLLDFREFEPEKKAPTYRVLSPTRRALPHPFGLNHQNIPSTKDYLIWHPEFARKAHRYPEMVRHMQKVNFSCKHPEEFDYVKKKGKLPRIKYTENTISRESYVNPTRFPEVQPDHPTTRFGAFPRKAVTGIVPTLIVPEYLPVLER